MTLQGLANISERNGDIVGIFLLFCSRRILRIRLIGIKFTGLVHGCHQMDLFEDTEELISLYETMDKIKNRFGVSSVGRASGFLK